MTFEYSILLPPTALAILTGFVWLRMGSDRLGEPAAFIRNRLRQRSR